MISAALNPEPNGVSFAIKRDGNGILETFAEMSNRDSRMLPKHIFDALESVGMEIQEIERWTVGSGPGSFTSLRATAALVGGMSLGRQNVKCRCIPGAVALVSSTRLIAEEKVGAIYDGRNHEIIYYGLVVNGGQAVPTGETMILNRDNVKVLANRGERLFCHESESESIAKIFNDQLEMPTAVKKTNTYALVDSNAAEFDNDLTNLVYIRPAVIDKQ